ncbi:hypothetical protein KC331_g391 [Hortaea werneckii]|nr:hypothetical protein KC361_g8660 [Hortaea werneckii]KAI7345114.1 hypothetical protein KC320_g8494 [Hortaea werneckii]KAI7554660.1 hypothetical protein KC331_g391 [Hortaea werneckii]
MVRFETRPPEHPSHEIPVTVFSSSDTEDKRTELLLASRRRREANSNLDHRVKRTSDAVHDAANISHLSSIVNKRASQILFDTSIGIDIDDLVDKCIAFMRNTKKVDHYRTQGQERQIQHADENDCDGIPEPSLDWVIFRHHICLRSTKRPAVPNFLLGPLSVEKSHRRLTQREPYQAHKTNSREVHPEVVLNDTLQNATLSESPALTTICTQIMSQFSQHIAQAARVLEQRFIRHDVETASYKQACTELRVTSNCGIRLFDWIINPHSFGQSVENLFSDTFLIKEGALG